VKTVSEAAPIFRSDDFTIRSSIADDAWRGASNPAAYEWWYFDALSDDGRDCVVMIFLDNFVFSPRYNRFAQTIAKADGDSIGARAMRFPAVAFCLYRDGRLLFRAINEYGANDFSAAADVPQCRIGGSKFALQTSSKDVRYEISIDEPLRGGRRLAAHFSFTLQTADFETKQISNAETSPLNFDAADSDQQTHEWNLVAPRCRVEGEIETKDARGVKIGAQKFQGTGYHDHNRDARPLTVGVKSWQWGRAHFADETTAIFYRYIAKNSDAKPLTKLLIARRDEITIYDAQFSAADMKRDIFGVSYPRELIFRTNAEEEKSTVALRLSQNNALDRSFFYLRFLSRAALETNDGKILQASAVTEHLAPRALGWRWLDWLVRMRIGAQDRAAFLP
jgi:carotenoid 1,2-hydratase